MKFIAAILLLTSAAQAAPTVYVEALNVRKIDGDTIVADVVLPLNITLKGEHIRAANYDAAESQDIRQTKGKGPSKAELVQGKQASKEFGELLAAPNTRVFLVPTKRDSFGRVLAEIWLLKGGEWIDMKDYATGHGWIRK